MGVATALCRLGRFLREQGKDHLAALAFHEALEQCATAGNRFTLVLVFSALSEIASRHGQAREAALIIGAINAIAQQAGATRLPTAGTPYDRATSAATAELGSQQFAEVVEMRQALSLAQTIGLARTIAIPPAGSSEPIPAWLLFAADKLELCQQDALTGSGRSTNSSTSWPHDSGSLPDSELTYREQEVLALLVQRLTDTEIAERLTISRKTVSTHVSHILDKLGAKNRREAAAIAVRGKRHLPRARTLASLHAISGINQDIFPTTPHPRPDMLGPGNDAVVRLCQMLNQERPMDRNWRWIGRVGLVLVGVLSMLLGTVHAQDATPAPAAVTVPPLFQRWFATYEAEDAAGFAALYTPDGVYEDVASASAAHGTEAIQATAEAYFATQDDYAFVPTSFVQGDDWVAMEYLLSATDVASGIRITNVRVATIFELEDGLILRSSDYYDVYGVLDQLGVLPGDEAPVDGTPVP